MSAALTIPRLQNLPDVSPGTPAKGDVFVFDGTNYTRLGVGTDTYLLTADSTQALGLKWAAAADLSVYAAKARTISTTAPITGGGDLSANRTFAMAAATTAIDGYLSHTDWNTFNGKGAGTCTSVRLTDSTGIFNITGSPVTGSGSLSLSSFQSNSTGNLFLATPSGGGGALSLRAIAVADVPPMVRSGTNAAAGLAPSPGTVAATTHYLREDATWAVPPNSGGTVTSFSFTTANGVSGSVTNSTTTPSLALTLGAITPSTVAATGAVTAPNLISSHGAKFDGGAVATPPTVGTLCQVNIPFAATIVKARVLLFDSTGASVSGSAVVGVTKNTFAAYTSGTRTNIVASAPPTCTAAKTSEDATLTGWTTAVAAGDVIEFSLTSVTTAVQVMVLLDLKKA